MIEFIIAWLCCSALAYGRAFAVCQRKYPLIAMDGYRGDLLSAAKFSFGGPLSLMAIFVSDAFDGDLFKYGFKFY